MKTEKFMRVVGDIGGDLIEKYADVRQGEYRTEGGEARSPRPIGFLLAVAAALLLALGIFAALRGLKTAKKEREALVPTAEPTGTVSPTGAPTADPGPTACPPTADPGPTACPPQSIRFYSMAEYREFAAASELDEDEFRRFIEPTGWLMNGVSTTEDAKQALAALDAIPMPAIDGFVFNLLDLCYFYNRIHISFKSDDLEGRYVGFDITLSPNDESAEELLARVGPQFALFPEKVSPELDWLVYRPDEPESILFTNLRSHRVRISSYMQTQELLDVLSKTRFITVREYAETIGLAEPTPVPKSSLRDIFFEEPGALAAFAASAELDDTAFAAFLSENGYADMGFVTKADVRYALEHLSAFPFPLPRGYELKHVEYSFLFNRLMLEFIPVGGETGDDLFLAMSWRGTELENAERLRKALSEHAYIELELPPDSAFDELWIYTLEPEDDMHIFSGIIGGAYAEFELRFAPRSEAAEMLLSFDFGTLTDAFEANNP